jgi:hypothetical protein
LLALAVLAVAATAGSAGDSGDKQGPKPAAKDPPPSQTYTVSTSTRGKGDWSLFGVYHSEAVANSVRESLAEHGFDIKVEKSTTLPVPRVQPRAPTGMLPKSETITYKKCVEVFNWLARQKDIAFHFPVDGCYARAHLMCQRMRKTSPPFRPRKIWSFSNGDILYARTRHNPRGYVTWGYHVAPVMRVRLDDDAQKQRWYVIDPSMFDRPATVTQWEQAQMRTKDSPRPYLAISRIGEAPIGIDRKKKPGSGYWPGADPPAGPDAHAVAMMKKYKPWEGKEPPKGAARRGNDPHPAAFAILRLPPDALPTSLRCWSRRRPALRA